MFVFIGVRVVRPGDPSDRLSCPEEEQLVTRLRTQVRLQEVITPVQPSLAGLQNPDGLFTTAPQTADTGEQHQGEKMGPKEALQPNLSGGSCCISDTHKLLILFLDHSC